MPWPGAYTTSDALETTAITILWIEIHVRWGTNCGKGSNYGNRTWSGETIGGAVFGPAGPFVARTTYGVTESCQVPTANLEPSFGVISSVVDLHGRQKAFRESRPVHISQWRQ